MAATPITVLLAGGGTAGHIEPALAVGEALRDKYGANVEALGTTKGLETNIIPARGVALHLIDPVPIPRKNPLKLLGVPGKLLRSVKQARKVIRETSTDVVFGTGGYVSASAYLAAKLEKKPFFVLETNALAGMANKLGVKLGGVGLNAVEDSGMEGEVVGVPVRAGMGEAEVNQTYGLNPNEPVLLVTGGSQGARSINEALEGAIDDLLSRGWQVLHAYGPKNEQPRDRENYVALPYIDDMRNAYALADVIVCRSGAMTVAEVSASLLPAIYVPLPHGNGEQAGNSAEQVAVGAAIRIDDADLTSQRLVQEVSLLEDEETRQKMSTKLDVHFGGGAAEIIAKRIVEAAS